MEYLATVAFHIHLKTNLGKADFFIVISPMNFGNSNVLPALFDVPNAILNEASTIFFNGPLQTDIHSDERHGRTSSNRFKFEQLIYFNPNKVN